MKKLVTLISTKGKTKEEIKAEIKKQLSEKKVINQPKRIFNK